MRTNRLILTSLLLFAFFSCQKDPTLVTFDVERQATFNIPPSTLLELPNIVTPVMGTNWEADFASNDTRKDKLREVYLKRMVMRITNPPGKTFRFVESIRIYIRADGLEETEVATSPAIPNTVGQELVMIPIRVNLNPYIQRDNFTMRAYIRLDEVNADNVDVTSDLTFEITADALD